MSKIQTTKRFVASIFLSAAAGGVGSIFTSSSIQSWYQYLNKPSFNPPNWLFGPVWSVLYTLMGIALFLVWQTGFEKPRTKQAVIFFILHLAVNAGWSWAFFGLHSPLLGICAITALWLMIVISMVMFYPIKKLAAWLLLPYLLWVSFAAVLNFYVYRLNI